MHMKQYLIALLLALTLSSASAFDVYWVDKNGNYLEKWHINDGVKGWMQSEDYDTCVAEVELRKALAKAADAADKAAAKGEK